MNFYVYVIFRKSGVPCYVGKGSGGRWAKHVSNARNPHLRNIYEQAGGDLPVIKVREDLTENEAFALEMSLIAAIGRKKHGGPLVNFTDGGDGPTGWEHTPEARAVMSEAAKRRMADPKYLARVTASSKATRSTPEYSAKRSEISRRIMEDGSVKDRIRATKRASFMEHPERRVEISKATKAAMAKETVRAKVSEAQKKRFEDPAERAKISARNLGRRQSTEEREKRAASMRGQKRSEESRSRMSAAQFRRFERPGECLKISNGKRLAAIKRKLDSQVHYPKT